MNNVNFVEIAEKCVNTYKESFPNNSKNIIAVFGNVRYVAIDKDNNIQTSMTPDILRNADQCLLVFKRTEWPYRNPYSFYDILYISSEGKICTPEELKWQSVIANLDCNYTLSIGHNGTYSCQHIYLTAFGKCLYNTLYSEMGWEERDSESALKKIWKLYLKCKECKTPMEAELLCQLVKKDEQILELKEKLDGQKITTLLAEKQRDVYKSLLDEIKEMVKK